MKTFEPKIHFQKRKKKVDRSIPVAASYLTTTASTCEHELIADYDLGYYICKLCCEVVDNIYINDDKDDKVKQSHPIIWQREYDRNRWKNYGIDYMMGVHNDKLSDQVWLEVLSAIPIHFNWYQIYKIFQKFDETHALLPWWTGFGAFVGMKVPITVEVMEKVDQYLNYSRTKYRIPYQYLMYKFVQMQNPGMEKYVPLNRSRAWLQKTDEWWKGLCEEEKMEYMPSEIHELSWDKDRIVGNLQSHLEKCGLMKVLCRIEDPDEVQHSSRIVRERQMERPKLPERTRKTRGKARKGKEDARDASVLQIQDQGPEAV